ncbi:MAG: DUF2235 domain-containing protein [Gemmatimonadaceae bacterium]|nr:DUF2235 domain-containing protein [Acetobacteraceae bacterium]
MICCDGTANEFAADRTNVVKLCSVLRNGPGQVVYYQPGLGTMEPPGALSGVSGAVTKLLGRAVGYGLEADVRNAYVFLMETYEDGDRVFLFGFSRGAYTVRAVASLVKMYGLLPRGNHALVPYAIRLLKAVGKFRERGVRDAFHLADEFKATFAARNAPVHFVGVWDTVSSIGWIGNPLRLPYTANNPDIAIGRHAVAIDERRAFYRTNLWRASGLRGPSGPRDLVQVWFPGVHSDVGGGYPDAEGRLSDMALEWMVDEGTCAGLDVDPDKVAALVGPGGARPGAPMHRSLKGLWWLAEIVPKRRAGGTGWRLNLGRGRQLPKGSLVHWSAFERPGYAARLPDHVIRYPGRSA